MDVTTILVIFVAGLIAIGLTAYMLNRAWGDFPGRIGPPGRGPSPAPPSSSPARAIAPAEDEAWGEGEEAPLPAGAPEGGLIPVTHPMVKRAIESALERGGNPYATYFIRDGERVYFAAYRIADPVERERATRLFQELNGGDFSGVNFSEMLGVIQRLGKGQ